ncbi:hypothetical protein RFI_33330 [Reticulomyxa filosa]|uniref:Uncharacterized protein n=1 Tax=Reticulomyxa filosa TaxID=46433 RepID=X6LSI0_RETFI|nr:hypothetical protein RFI_33330 [Reticulomyxa filosa]|eukprot:ETO04072.1 hypothetical protein RFI_33330 [Reticulomyxa filosa]
MEEENDHWKHCMLLEISDYSTHLEEMKKELEAFSQANQQLQHQLVTVQTENQTLRFKISQTDHILKQLEMERNKFIQPTFLENNMQFYLPPFDTTGINELMHSREPIDYTQMGPYAPDTMRAEVGSTGQSER